MRHIERITRWALLVVLALAALIGCQGPPATPTEGGRSSEVMAVRTPLELAGQARIS